MSESVTRREQGLALAADGWKPLAIAVRLNVSDTTVYRWLNPAYAERNRAARKRWGTTEKCREVKRRYRAKLRAQALSTPAPEGEWVMVPKEPTEEMLKTIRYRHWEVRGCQLIRDDYKALYKVMIAAAPAPVRGVEECPPSSQSSSSGKQGSDARPAAMGDDA